MAGIEDPEKFMNDYKELVKGAVDAAKEKGLLLEAFNDPQVALGVLPSQVAGMQAALLYSAQHGNTRPYSIGHMVQLLEILKDIIFAAKHTTSHP